MKKKSGRVFTILFVLFSFLNANALITTATGTGNWNNSGTWNNGIPGCGDTIIIASTANVSVTSNVDLDENNGCSIPIHLKIDGILAFNTGRKMYLPCNSFLEVTSSGTLDKGTGGGSSNVIDICQTTVWSASDGSVPGPSTYGNGTGLPITLVEFNASTTPLGVELTWITASEINNDFFTIQRSIDGILFENIGIIHGAGNSNVILHYNAFDDNPLPGTSYYRLKQTDFDGKYSYSGLKVVTRNDGEISNLIIYPNPSQGILNLKYSNETPFKGRIQVIDKVGREVHQIVVNQNENIDLSHLKSGHYLIKLLDDNPGRFSTSRIIIKDL